MDEIQVVKHPQFGQLSVITLDGREMFKAKEVAEMLGYKNINDAIARHCKGVVKHDLPSASGYQEYNLIPEGDVWRLIIRSKLPQAMEIEKWIMDEVLPELRKNGAYRMKPVKTPIQRLPKPYAYEEKTYSGEPVLSSADMEHFTGLERSTPIRYARNSLKEGADYFDLTGDALAQYRTENKGRVGCTKAAVIFSRSGFWAVCEAYGIDAEAPAGFEKEDVAAARKIKEIDTRMMVLHSLLSHVRCRAEIDRMADAIRAAGRDISDCIDAMLAQP